MNIRPALSLFVGLSAWCAACSGDSGSGNMGGTTVPGDDGGPLGHDAGAMNLDGAIPQDASTPPPPTTVCTAVANPVDTSKPRAVVGTGSASSCTESAFRTAVAAGGIVTFN